MTQQIGGEIDHLGCVWLRREVVKREISVREFEKREIKEKLSRFTRLFCTRDILEK